MLLNLLLFSALASPLTLVESTPSETDLDHPEIVNADELWAKMIRNAQHTIQWASFYVSTSPEEDQLTPIFAELHKAGNRGVQIEILLDSSLVQTYQRSVVELQQLPNTEVRFLEAGVGVMHAKYLVIDGQEAYLGSHNLDWRSLEHIQELGVHISDRTLSEQLIRIFNIDWALANEQQPFIEAVPRQSITFESGTASIAGSPSNNLPHPSWFELPLIIEQIDNAKDIIHIQVLTYNTKTYTGNDWYKIDKALRKAAIRGVKVEMLVSDWGKSPSSLPSILSLSNVENIHVKWVTIPQHSSGFIPYARVAHAKYIIVDEQWAWVGTSNLSKDYFYTGRNVGLLIQDTHIGKQLSGYFKNTWLSSYAYSVTPQNSKPPPRVK